jgi:hypothetical protein
MEHREPPRILTGDHRLEEALGGPDGSFSFRRFPFVRNQRQFRLGRTGLLILVALSVLVAFVYLGVQAARTAFGWLHHQSQYQYPFQDIQLVPDPPPWFRGGRPAFLESVRQDANERETIPVLDLAPEQLADEFRKYPWVRDVEKVFYRPRAIVVHLRYRQPVAYIQISPADQKLLDETGTILSVEDVDVVKLSHLIKIIGMGSAPPTGGRPGVIWTSRLPGSDRDEPDRRILAAAKLAGFLAKPAQVSGADRWPALRMIEINVTNFHPHGLFLRNAENSAIWWSEPPGDELAGRPTAEQKWAMLERWCASPGHQPLPIDDYWAFSGTQVEPVCHHDDHPHGIKRTKASK